MDWEAAGVKCRKNDQFGNAIASSGRNDNMTSYRNCMVNDCEMDRLLHSDIKYF